MTDATSNFDAVFRDYLDFRSTGRSINDLVELPAILALLSRLNFASACDIASGTGTYIPDLSTRADKVLCCDSSPSAIRHCQERYGDLRNVTYLCDDYRKLASLFHDEFDLVLASLAIFDRLERILGTAREILRQSGTLIYSHFHPIYGSGKQSITEGGITVANYWGSRRRVAVEPFGRRLHNQPYTVSWDYHTIEEHVRMLRAEHFAIDAIIEPRPPSLNESERLSRRANMFPVLIIFVARKESK